MGKKKNKKHKKQKDKDLFIKWLNEHDDIPDKDNNQSSLEGYKPFSKLDYDEIKKKKLTYNKNKKKKQTSQEEDMKSGRAFSDDDKHLFFKWLGEEGSNEIKNKDENNENEDNRYKRPFSSKGKKLKKSIKPKHKKYKKFYVEDDDFMEKWLAKNEDKIFDKDSEMKKDEQYMYPPNITDAFRLDSSLDLHGFKVDEAIFMLKSFIKECFDRNDKVVKVIHGKGLHSTGGTSKLKKAVKTWISHEGKSYISFYKVAPKKHGGTGAVIIWLK